MKRFMIPAAALALLGGASACQPARDAEARSAPTSSFTPTVVTPTASSTAALRYVTAPQGNAARYRIREQLVGLDLPNDAVGETKNVTGVIAVDAAGKIIPAESKFTVEATTLVSDKDRRDGFVRRRVLQTDQFPTVTLVPKEIRGLSLPLPTSGSKTFEVVGDLTVRGVTKPTVWKASAQFQPGVMNGSASTSFTFQDFAIDQPRVPVVLSVDETIKLELDFRLIADPAKK